MSYRAQVAVCSEIRARHVHFFCLYNVWFSNVKPGGGVRGDALGWGTALQARRSRVQFPMGSLWFFIDIILRLHCGPGVDPVSNRNEYHEYFLGGKVGLCVGLATLRPSCADCLEILEALTSCSPQGLSRPVYGLVYLCPFKPDGALRNR